MLFFCLLLALLFLRGFLGPIPGCFSLSFTSVRSVFFCSPHPSPAAIGLLFRTPSTRCMLLLLPLSWLTDSLFLSPVVGLLFCASSTRCRLLLLFCRFLVSVRASPRSLASSGLTATFWSSTFPRRVTLAQLRAPLLVCSAPPAPSCGSLQRRGCCCSLQHCCVVLCYGVVAGPAPLR